MRTYRIPVRPLFAAAGLVIMLATTSGAARPGAGDVDPSFGTDGKVMTDFVGGIDDARAVFIQHDSKLLVAGATGQPLTAPNRLGLARYTANGKLDTSFGAAGKVSAPFAGERNNLTAVIALRDGRLVAAGRSFDDDPYGNFALARYSADGIPDRTFGIDGTVTTGFGKVDEVRALVEQPDRRLVAAGYTTDNTTGSMSMARYMPDGTLDRTFGADGKVTVDTGIRTAEAMVLQADGKMVVAGSSVTSGMAVARLTPNGTLDPTFGNGGTVLTTFDSNTPATALVLQTDGKVVVAGRHPTLEKAEVVLLRYGPDGTPDATFGAHGRVTTDFGAHEDAEIKALTVQGHKIVAAGSATGKFGFEFAVLRLNASGSLDSSFGTQGRALTDLADSADDINAIAWQGTKLIAVGTTRAVQDQGNFAVVRYRTR